jgi:hypothetical protein
MLVHNTLSQILGEIGFSKDMEKPGTATKAKGWLGE